jgi:hypothetical protein
MDQSKRIKELEAVIERYKVLYESAKSEDYRVAYGPLLAQIEYLARTTARTMKDTEKYRKALFQIANEGFPSRVYSNKSELVRWIDRNVTLARRVIRYKTPGNDFFSKAHVCCDPPEPCKCEVKDRQWHPNKDTCDTCGLKYTRSLS